MNRWSRREFLTAAAGAAVLAGVPPRAGGEGAGAMILRKIPASGEALPAIGMGTSRTFDVGEGEAERAPLAEVLRLFFAAGARAIDSSPMYGRAETVVGDLLAAGGLAGRAFLATKVWTEGRKEGIAQMEESFRRLRAKRIDLMQVHNLIDTETHLKTLRAWKEQGRIRYVGITHYRLDAFDDLATWMRKHPLDFVQLPYSIGVRDAEKRLLPLAADRGIAVLVMRPFEGGSLFRDARERPLPPFAAELGATGWAQLFLKFILAHPAVTCAIPATSKPEHMKDNLGALRGPLPDAAQRKRLIELVGA